jgi:hypothetical protein
MPHHFLYHYNAYHNVIAKPSLPHLYLYYIQNFIERFSPYLAKLPSTTAKANAYLVGAGAVWSGVGTLGSPSSRSPYRIPGMIKPSLPHLYLYCIQKISAQVARYFPKLPSKRATHPVALCPQRC